MPPGECRLLSSWPSVRISAAMARTAFMAETSEEEARERRELARQSGNPAWLWPEVAVAEWLETMRYVSEALSSVLSGRPGTIPPSDPRTFSLACYTSGAGPLLGYWVERRKLVVPDDLEELLALHLENARARASKTEFHSREIVSELVGDGVPVVILKGAHTGHAYFPDPATRPASDLDLLVPSDFAAQAEVSLAKRGLQCAARNRRKSSWKRAESPLEPRSLWLAHADDPWCVDLQSSLDFSASPGARPVRFDSADPIGTSDPWPLNPEAGALSQPLLLLHLAAHASGGLHSLTLLRMVEIILVDSEGHSGWPAVLGRVPSPGRGHECAWRGLSRASNVGKAGARNHSRQGPQHQRRNRSAARARDCRQARARDRPPRRSSVGRRAFHVGQRLFGLVSPIGVRHRAGIRIPGDLREARLPPASRPNQPLAGRRCP